MAWRNIWRNRRRSLVTMAAMSLALLVMIEYSGLAQGYMLRMEANIVDIEVGDLQIFAPGYRDEPSIYNRIEAPDALLARLADAGYAAAPRLLAAGLVAAGDTSAGVSFTGIDPGRDAKVSEIYKHLAAGRWLDPSDPKGVVIGKRLARALDVGVGAELVVLTQGADGAMAYDLYTVRGVLRGIGDATDRTGIFMTAGAFRELLVVPDGVHQIIVRRPAAVDLPSTAARVHGLARELDVKTWRQLLPTISSMLDSARGVMIAMFFIVYIAIGMLILNAMLMAVFERIREFGVLKALGVGPFEVLRLIVAESAIQTGIAILVGVSFAVPGIWYLSSTGINLAQLGGVTIMGIAWDPIWRAAVHVGAFTEPILVLVAIVAVAVLYPALKAALIRPVDAMHHQ